MTRLHDHTFATDQTWSGTVTIDGVVQFAPEATLTILPGTTVLFSKTDTDGDGIGENELYVQGRIIANGTPDKPITFTSSEETKRPGDWGALNIMVSEGQQNELSNCIMEYGYRGFHMHFSKATLTACKLRDNYLGIQCQDSELSVTGCEITRNRGAIVFKDSKLVIRDNVISDNYWGIRFLYGEAELTGNTISGNMINGVTFRENKVKAAGNILTGNRKGFSAEMSEVDMRGNVVRGSVESGLYLKHATGAVSGNVFSGNGNAGVSIEDSDVKITGNDITGNGYYGIDNNGAMDVNAMGNWWGTTDAAQVAGMIYDKDEDAKLGRVVFEPVAVAPSSVMPAKAGIQ
ncbi:MAG: right-handed parallel beta-helix repeat-containing protein [Nitrospirae bacterium]|nr:right-handed parallel beta-helix repeat-containing protein [Nitrospirota bacterium]